MADFMGKNRTLVEAERESLYQNFSVPGNWHEAYAEDNANTQAYRE